MSPLWLAKGEVPCSLKGLIKEGAGRGIGGGAGAKKGRVVVGAGV